MKILQLMNTSGRGWANQIVVENDSRDKVLLKSYSDFVVGVDYQSHTISLSPAWDYSNTTLRAVCKFLHDFVGFEEKIAYGDIDKALEKGYALDRYESKWYVVEKTTDEFEKEFEKLSQERSE